MDFVDNRIDPETGTIRGRAILRNPDKSLTPGLFVTVRLPGSQRYDAVLVPDRAISADQDKRFVYVVDARSMVARRNVELGPMRRGLRIVRDGLSGDDTIVLSGLQRVRPGVTVEARPETFELGEDLDGLPDEYAPLPESEWIRIDYNGAREGGTGEGEGR